MNRLRSQWSGKYPHWSLFYKMSTLCMCRERSYMWKSELKNMASWTFAVLLAMMSGFIIHLDSHRAKLGTIYIHSEICKCCKHFGRLFRRVISESMILHVIIPIISYNFRCLWAILSQLLLLSSSDHHLYVFLLLWRAPVDGC